jgi:hypothetical protein
MWRRRSLRTASPSDAPPVARIRLCRDAEAVTNGVRSAPSVREDATGAAGSSRPQTAQRFTLPGARTASKMAPGIPFEPRPGVQRRVASHPPLKWSTEMMPATPSSHVPGSPAF